MRRRGPVVALRGGVVEVRGVAVAGGRKEDAPVRVSPRARHQSPLNAVGDPRGGAIVDEVVVFLIRRHAPRGAEVRRRRVMRRHEIGGRVDPALRLKRRIVLVHCRTRCRRRIRIWKRTVAHLFARARHPCHVVKAAGAFIPSSSASGIPHRVAPPEVVAEFLRLRGAHVALRPIRPVLP